MPCPREEKGSPWPYLTAQYMLRKRRCMRGTQGEGESPGRRLLRVQSLLLLLAALGSSAGRALPVTPSSRRARRRVPKVVVVAHRVGRLDSPPLSALASVPWMPA